MASTQSSAVLMIPCSFPDSLSGVHSGKDWPINEVILSGPQDLWDFQGDLSLSLARHPAQPWWIGRKAVWAQCALGPDLLDVRLSPDGKHIAWLDRKSLHVVQSDSCESRTHAWSQLWPSAPPAPVQVQWADSEHLVSHTTPPLRVPISQPEQSRPLGQSRMVPIGSMHSVGSMHLCGDSRGLVFDCDSGAVHFELSSRISSVSFFQGEFVHYRLSLCGAAPPHGMYQPWTFIIQS